MKPRKPLRILHLRTVRGTGGGPDKTVLKSCEYLANHGLVADALYMLDRRSDTGRLQDQARELGVRLIAAMEDSPISPATVRLLHRTLGRGRYDIVHTHEYKSNALAQLMRPLHSVTVVATAHGYNRTTLREAVYYGVERAIFRHVAAVVTPNRAMYDLVRRLGVPASRVHVIHNGIITAGLAPPQPHTRSRRVHLLYLGRLSREKDPQNAIHALDRLVRDGHDAELALAGDGPQRDDVQRLAEKLRLTDRVRLLGFVGDVMPLLGNADILVSPSRTECMPNAILEAMWARVPVAATDVGGVGEMVRDDAEALLCPPRDPGALADAVADLITDEPLARRLAGHAHRRLMNEFTFEKRMERMLELYQRLIHAKR